MSNVDGLVEDGWGQVADTFRANFKEGKDLGAACCVYVDGRAVVDLWGGLADREKNRPWERDTVALVASTTKGATAICAHLLVQRGQLDLDAPVIRYWPEFGAAGKEKIPVRWLLSHQAGLPYVDTPVTFEEACAWDPLIRALEVQKPLWTPGTEHLYHAMTYGFLVGEVIRRITGRSPGTFFAEEIAQPLGLSAWIGLPEEVEPRIARIEAAPFPYKSMEDLAPDFAKLMGLDLAVAVTLVKDVYGPGSAFMKAGAVGDVTGENVLSRAYRAAEFPGANMFANAHSIARMYAATVSDVDGIRLLQPDTVAAMTVAQTDRTRMHGAPPELLPATKNLFNMSLGFVRSAPPVMSMFGPASFGHPGSGGSLGAADPESRVGFGYVPNLWAATMVDPRAIELTSAVAKCLG
ncbi:EstA family serine hydrolase [Singulisphaera acidiphila]|uniref:Penicillin-binding protein, beta-lactamase class C n=1 Tax=Singulisphaera acidiphila (strain ATCC BAA-1392 / DSM 18658 / VKM B-2454 / MOB10) TaxID=886293 RepID=L0DI23_SINAD|nr:EstA family serine hydrolase [Singulisphaera acidiphila]AGA28458.1 penicillin-binding protein, beta-lactamase class C [Singulisphaera acidiphila DSM 18658]